MKRIKLDFHSAHSIVTKSIHSKNVKGYNDWQRYTKTEEFPLGVPKQPQITYKDKGWVSWGHWLGTGNISNIQKSSLYFSHDDAREIVLKDLSHHKIISKNGWSNHLKANGIPEGIPSDPQQAYKDKGWVSWGNWLNTNNVKGGYSSRKHNVNNDFFSEWNLRSAYVFGFWMADGCMKDHRRFSIYQHQNDSYILKNMLYAMNSSYPIYLDRECSYIDISSEKICKDIVLLGGCKAKSKIIEFPATLPDKYFFDFIRGFFDGDGCITYDKNSKKHMSYITSASSVFLKGIKREMYDRGIEGIINNQCSIKFNAKNTVKLGKNMYHEDIGDLFLKRKYDKFLLAYQTLSGLENMI